MFPALWADPVQGDKPSAGGGGKDAQGSPQAGGSGGGRGMSGGDGSKPGTPTWFKQAGMGGGGGGGSTGGSGGGPELPDIVSETVDRQRWLSAELVLILQMEKIQATHFDD